MEIMCSLEGGQWPVTHLIHAGNGVQGSESLPQEEKTCPF